MTLALPGTTCTRVQALPPEMHQGFYAKIPPGFIVPLKDALVLLDKLLDAVLVGIVLVVSCALVPAVAGAGTSRTPVSADLRSQDETSAS